MRFFSFFDKIQPYMRLSDWVLATVSLLYGALCRQRAVDRRFRPRLRAGLVRSRHAAAPAFRLHQTCFPGVARPISAIDGALMGVFTCAAVRIT